MPICQKFENETNCLEDLSLLHNCVLRRKNILLPTKDLGFLCEQGKAFRILVNEKDLTKSPLAVRQVAKQKINHPIISADKV